MRKKIDKIRKIALNNYRNSQMELKRTIEHHINKKKTKDNRTTRSQFKTILEHCEANEKKQQRGIDWN